MPKMKIEVQEKYLKTGNHEMQMGIQGAAMIRLASSSSQEANAMVSLSNGWLEWPGEVNVQTLFFGYGGYGKWCYSYGMQMGMTSIYVRNL